MRDVDPSGLAYDADLRENMVIEKVNRVAINTLQDFERVFGSLKPGDPVVMNVAARTPAGQLIQSIVQFTYQ